MALGHGCDQFQTHNHESISCPKFVMFDMFEDLEFMDSLQWWLEMQYLGCWKSSDELSMYYLISAQG